MSPRLRLDLTQIRECKGPGCHATFGICRHHKGNDRYLGKFNRSIRKNYMKYLDCVELCPECHCKVHYNYILIMDKHEDWTPLGVRKLRRKLIKACDEWLAGSRKFRKPSALFRARFIGNYIAWRTNKSRNLTSSQ